MKAEVESHKEKIGQMQVVLQEFESTVMEMAEKYEEEKGILEKQKDEVWWVNICIVLKIWDRFV